MEFFPYMYEIERFFVNVRKLAALNIADQVNETVCIDNTITLDVNIPDNTLNILTAICSKCIG